MADLVREGVRLAYEERGTGGRPVLLVHGILCDRRYLAPQLEHLGRTRRVVAVDLRGHGQSDAPEQDYTIAGLADDLVWMCRHLGLDRPVVVGHSLGGVVGLALSAGYPDLIGGLVLLDSVLLTGASRRRAVGAFLDQLRSDRYLDAVRNYFRQFFAPSDDAGRREWILEQIGRVPPYVGISIWQDGTFGFDDAAALAACRLPLLYIDAGTPNVDLARLAELAPARLLGRTVGSGHFHQLEVPDQVNAMLDRFLLLLESAPTRAGQARSR